MVDYSSIISKIVFDIKFCGEKKYHKDVTLRYEDDFNLTMEELHHEDNESWNKIELVMKDNVKHLFNIQFFGIDESLANNKKGEYVPRFSTRIPLSYNIYEVVWNDETKNWDTKELFTEYNYGCHMRSVRIYTKSGEMKRVSVK